MAHPDVEFVRPGSQHVLRGREALREWMEPDAFDEQHYEVHGMTVADDKVLVSQRVRARGAGSGIEIDTLSWVVWTFDDAGLVTRIAAFLPHEEAEAYEAAGLSPPPE
jgi:hypothetical protein